jgi:hypothetical protein
MPEAWAAQELQAAAVWDRRCIRSLIAIGERRFERPVVSFSAACGNAARQAAHRIFTHSTTPPDGLLRGHFDQTRQRCLAAWQAKPSEPLLVVQDTTTLYYTGHPATTGLGPIHTSPKSRGLLAHAALALTLEGPPLGLTHLSVWARDPQTHGKTRAGHARWGEPVTLKESQKWIDGVWGTEATLPPEMPVVIIGDREADFYELFAAPRRPNTHLLVRANHPRKVRLADPATTPGGRTIKLPQGVAEAGVLGSMEVNVPRAPGRRARQATLELRAVEVWLPAPAALAKQYPGTNPLVHLWVVQVLEQTPPAGEKPLCWVLLTSLPAASLVEARTLVRYYARRWLGEDLHLVLKSGLRAERLQFDDAHSLKNVLALYYLVAWRVLFTRDTARWLPETPAEQVVTAEERAVLEAVEGRSLPTVRAVTRAIGHLAGFPRYPSAGEPGVRSLWLGLQRLEAMVVGWQLARHHAPL